MADISHKAGEINRANLPVDAALEGHNTPASRPTRIRAFLRTLLQDHPRDVPHDFEWSVVAFGVGIAVYFALGFEPSWLWLGAIFAGMWGIYTIWDRSGRALRALWPFLLCLWAVFGLFRASWHSAAIDTVTLREGGYTVTGWIEAVERSGTGSRWLIRVDTVEGRDVIDHIYRVKVNVRKHIGTGGQGVSLRAVLSGPPPAVTAGGFDTGRKAFFDRVSGQGYLINTPEFIPLETTGPSEQFSRAVTTLRYSMADRIRARAPPQTAGLQVALLTGVRSFIPQEQTDSLRATGLAHILAISGLHMGLLSGSAFYLATLLLVLITPLSRRYDMRKPAAIIGALVATGYLILSGGSVATQRAFIMAIIIYAAIILDRRAFSIRSVSVAALITLMLHPESLISVGFQMSFAAVAALVIIYQHWQGGRTRFADGVVARTKSGFLTLSMTSFVAGSATGAYAVMHFGRMAQYGFAGNLIAMPLFSLLVMPAALATLIFMPIGAEQWPLAVMGAGLSGILWISDHIAAMPGALTHIKAPPDWVISAYSLAFVWLCLGQNKLRAVGLSVISACFIFWALEPSPDIRVSAEGRIAFWDRPSLPSDSGKGLTVTSSTPPALYVSSKRADRYGRGQFMRRAGEGEADITPYQNGRALCDALACQFALRGKTIAVLNHPSEVIEACDTADIVILTSRRAGPVARRHCGRTLLDPRVLNRSGAHDIYLGRRASDPIVMRHAVSEARYNRPWGRHYVPKRD